MEVYVKAFQPIVIVVVVEVALVVAAEVTNVAIVGVSDVDLVVAAEVMNAVIVVVSDVDLVVAELKGHLLLGIIFPIQQQQVVKERPVHLLP